MNPVAKPQATVVASDQIEQAHAQHLGAAVRSAAAPMGSRNIT